MPKYGSHTVRLIRNASPRLAAPITLVYNAVMPLHLIKLAVGSDGIEDLRRFQAARLKTTGMVFHLTRMIPRRADELTEGGSIYWVVRGLLCARQAILDVVEDRDDEGRRRCKLILAPDLIEVERRPCKPFQGWRYLTADLAPPDRRPGEEEPPPEMAAELRRLGLL